MQMDPNAVLNQLLVILHRSFAMYLIDARPWMHAGDERAMKVVGHLVEDQKRYVQRLTELLMQRRVPIDWGDYPIIFTDTHDLSLDYLVTEVIHYHKQDLAVIDACVEQLGTDLTARALAEEIRGNARGHLESLEEITHASA